MSFFLLHFTRDLVITSCFDIFDSNLFTDLEWTRREVQQGSNFFTVLAFEPEASACLWKDMQGWRSTVELQAHKHEIES